MAHPERIGKYPIVRVLGEGAMGVVYEAFDPVIKRPLAIKTIRRELIASDSAGAAAVARFKTEAQAAGALAHPGIASVYEYGEDERCAYIAMEFVSGNTLREYISRKTRFLEQDVVAIMAHLLDALAYAHSRRIIHRDIKPANLMITRDGRLKVTDFGIARVEANGITLAGAVIGTPGYMAPEQFSAEDIDHRADLYAAAASLYQVLTGQLPFTGTIEQVMYKTVMNDPVPPSSIEGAQRWAHFDDVVLRGLARDREQRYGSARAFREALLEVARQPGAETITEQTLIMEWSPPEGVARPPTLSRTAGTRGTGVGTGAVGGSATGTSLANELPPGWEAGTLARIEADLARHIGPLAKVLVRRAARETTDPGTLRERLAQHLSTPDEQTRFLGSADARERSLTATRVVAEPTTGPTVATGTRPGGETPADALPWDDALLERSVTLLTRRIGPIAKVMVRRAAQRSTTRGELFATLASMAADSTDPQSLLADLRALPSAPG